MEETKISSDGIETIININEPSVELKFGSLTVYVERNKKVNFIQRKMWKMLLGIEVRNIGANDGGKS